MPLRAKSVAEDRHEKLTKMLSEISAQLEQIADAIGLRQTKHPAASENVAVLPEKKTEHSA
jgi:hypothetical protein